MSYIQPQETWGVLYPPNLYARLTSATATDKYMYKLHHRSTAKVMTHSRCTRRYGIDLSFMFAMGVSWSKSADITSISPCVLFFDDYPDLHTSGGRGGKEKGLLCGVFFSFL